MRWLVLYLGLWLAAATVCAAVASARLDAYADEMTLSLDAMKHRPADGTPHYNVGAILARRGQLLESIPHFERAIELKPDSGQAHYNLGAILRHLGRHAEAIPHLELACRFEPKAAEPRYNLGLALAATGRPAEAVLQLSAALDLRPDYPAAATALERARAQQKGGDP